MIAVGDGLEQRIRGYVIWGSQVFVLLFPFLSLSDVLAAGATGGSVCGRERGARSRKACVSGRRGETCEGKGEASGSAASDGPAPRSVWSFGKKRVCTALESKHNQEKLVFSPLCLTVFSHSVDPWSL